MSAAMAPYRPAQGVYARSGMAGALLVLVLFGSYRVFQMTQVEGAVAFSLLGVDVPVAVLWAGGVFLVLGLMVFLFTFGPQTGLQFIDKNTHALIDLLIDTEAELAKVSWPNKEELTRSTTAVLLSMLLLAVFLFGVDQVVLTFMRMAGVLPG